MSRRSRDHLQFGATAGDLQIRSRPNPNTQHASASTDELGVRVTRTATWARLRQRTNSQTLVALLLVGVLGSVCVAETAMDARRDEDRLSFAAIVVAAGLAIVASQALRQQRRRRPVVEGKITFLRGTSRRDAPALGETIDADVVAENRWHPNVREHVIRDVRRSMLPGLWAICERETGAIVGAVTVTTAQGDKYEAELGVWIGPRDRGRGYTSDAIPAMVRLLRNSGYSTIAASTAVTNEAMQSALRRSGFAEQLRYTHQFPNGDAIPAIRFCFPPRGAPV